jgi:hypothetical protein
MTLVADPILVKSHCQQRPTTIRKQLDIRAHLIFLPILSREQVGRKDDQLRQQQLGLHVLACGWLGFVIDRRPPS